MKKKIPLTLAFACAVACAFGLAACGDTKDENDIVTADDWTAAFETAQNATRYSWDYNSECDPEYDFISQTVNNIGYNADEDQYFKMWRSSSDNYIYRYVWEKNGKYYGKLDDEDVTELPESKYLQYTDFDVLEKPFLLSFCKDRFSDFKYYSVSLDDGSVEYKATNIEIAVQRDENTFTLSGRGNIYVTFNKDKVITEIEAYVNTIDNERFGYRLMDIGTYDNSQFDSFVLPDMR